ncbi:hypothetical protein [Ensifer sp. SSB1]|uniref:hypothetical protein n=1 Tax=Ensifer sp. SSB1 TaxID=2795385 RepID=UPI001A3ED1AD|nr:hypothetical protein [Ensifer sp. SSB1]MBK5570877.1 hypothetical protein [Ensifer sp. SSB1]
MSDAERANQIVKTFEKRTRKSVSAQEGKSRTIPKAGDRPRAGMQTRVFSVTGKVKSEQVDASERDYIIEVRVRARRRSDNSQNPSAAGFQSLLDVQVKRDLQAIADRYPQVPEARLAPNEGVGQSTNLLQLLRTLM